MTTIIAQNGKLAADRRKAVNHFKVGIIGVRDEPKIVKLPFCLYGTTGFDLPPDVNGVEDPSKTRVVQQLAVLFALTYFCGSRFRKTPFYKFLKESKIPFDAFISNLRALRLAVGTSMAVEMKEAMRGVLAMDGHTTLFIDSENFHMYHNSEVIAAGSGRKLASILIDKGWKLKDIYSTIRASGCPTGEVFEVYDSRKEFADEFPPVLSLDFLFAFTTFIRDHIEDEIERKKLDSVGADKLMLNLTIAVAGFRSIGKLKRGKIVFSEKPKLNYSLKDVDDKAFELACVITRYQPVPKETK